MMNGPTRMSPLTALFLGLFGVGAVGITATTGLALYGMRIIDRNAAVITGFVEGTLADLPQVVERLPELLAKLPEIMDSLGGRRVPGYVENIEVGLTFVMSGRRDELHPVISITNHGPEVVSMLALRVAALNADHVPMREWTEIVATPLAIENEWRGPLFPGKTRHVVIHSRHGVPLEAAKGMTGAVEISELRLWQETKAF